MLLSAAKLAVAQMDFGYNIILRKHKLLYINPFTADPVKALHFVILV